MEKVAGEFLVYLEQVKGASKNTIQSYKRDLNHLMGYLAHQDITDIKKVTATQLNAYIMKLEIEGRAA